MRALPVLLLAALALCAFFLFPGTRTSPPAFPDPPDLPDGGALPGETGVTTPVPGSERAQPRFEEPVELPPATPRVRWPADREPAALEIRVLDAYARPAPGARVRLRSHTGPRMELYDLADDRGVERSATADAGGHARFEGLPDGPYEAEAAAPGEGSWTALVFLLEPPRTEITLRLDEHASRREELLVHVLGADRAPVSGASVELAGRVGDLRAGRALEEVRLTGLTDAGGVARLADPGLAGFLLVARAPDGSVGSAMQADLRETASGSIAVQVPLGAPASLTGTLTGAGSGGAAAPRVIARLVSSAHPYYTHEGIDFEAHVEGWRYEASGLPPGTYVVGLTDAGGLRLALPGASARDPIQPVQVSLDHGERQVRDLELARGATIEGLVLDGTGAPLAGALVRATLAPRNANFPAGFVLHGVHVWRFDSRTGGGESREAFRRARTDAEGRYVLEGLHPGRHRIELALPGLTLERREEVEAREGEVVRLGHVLAPAGAVQGLWRAGGYLGIARAGDEHPRMIAILPRSGQFCFAGLEPGRYALTSSHSDERVPPVHLAEVDVTAGRTSWIDLDAVARLPVRVQGRVLGAHGPIPGATVLLGSHRATTDAAGRFEAGLARPPGPWSQIVVLHRGLRWSWSLAEAAGATRWSQDVHLGEHGLLVRTLDAAGAPAMARLDLRLAVPAEGSLKELSGDRISTGERGEWAVDSLPAGTYTASARFEDGAQATATLALPDTSELVLRAPAVGTLAVRVAIDGDPPPGLRVTAAAWTAPGPPPEETSAFLAGSVEMGARPTDFRGHASLAGIPAGEVLVRAITRRGLGFEQEVLAERRLHLLPGETVEVELRPGSR